MADSVGGIGNTQPSGSSGTVEWADGVGDTREVGSGYSGENTQSSSDGDAAIDGGSVDMDVPVAVTMSSANYSQQVFNSRLVGFRSVINDFNTRFLTRGGNEIDMETLLSDTNTLLLAIRGFVKDLQSLNKAQTIGLAADAQMSLQGKSLEVTELEKVITDFEGSLADMVTEEDDGSGDEEGDFDTGLFEDTLQEKQAAESRLNTINDQKVRVEVALRDVRTALKGVDFQINSGSLETGEDRLLDRRLENQVEQHDSLLKARKKSKSTEEFRDLNKETVKHYNLEAEEQVEPGVVAEVLRELLTPQLLSKLSGIFAADGGYPDDDNPADQHLADAAEGLALILLAEPTGTSSEENPVDQPHLGDSFSLEGANNPQAFTLLLLQEKMSELQNSVQMEYGLLAEGAGAEAEEADRLTQIQDGRRAVDAMVVESLKDAELAAAAIRRHPV